MPGTETGAEDTIRAKKKHREIYSLVKEMCIH